MRRIWYTTPACSSAGTCTGRKTASPVTASAVRIDGKPRQRHIAYLGSIRHDCSGKVDYRVRFWRDARKVLDRLGKRLTAAERTRVEELIGERVRRPTAQQEKASRPGGPRCSRASRRSLGGAGRPGTLQRNSEVCRN